MNEKTKQGYSGFNQPIGKIEIDRIIRNPVLDMPNAMTLEYKTPPETVITQAGNKELAEKINEIIERINAKDECPHCSGTGRILESREPDLDVDRPCECNGENL